MNGKLAILASAIIAAACAHAAKEVVEGYTWEYSVSGVYSVSGGEATVIGVTPKTGNLTIPVTLGGFPVRKIGERFLYYVGYNGDPSPSSVVIPEGVTTIGSYAFYLCKSTYYIPSTVTYIGPEAFAWGQIAHWSVNENGVTGGDWNMAYMTIAEIVFNGKPIFQFGTGGSNATSKGGATISGCYRCKRRFASECMRELGASKFGGYIDDAPEVEIVSSSMRKDDPTVMDVVYKVYSSAQTVKVRAMAWENGERNLARAIRPTKWIEGTEANIGDAVTANEEHKLSWRIAGDWATDLSKVKLEVLAVEDDLLPLELQTIPATATHQKMKISWNKLTADHVFDALLWLYADGDAGLTLTNGQLKNGANLLASGTSLYNSETAVGYVFGKMGYQKLAGDELAYARRVTQLDLPVGDVQQYAVKYPDAK